jgi:hypothetical protein
VPVNNTVTVTCLLFLWMSECVDERYLKVQRCNLIKVLVYFDGCKVTPYLGDV